MGDYTTIIDGIPIRFPYENPYNIQIDYMKRVLKALKEGQHAILESPTGTGKTLSLLCATLGWISQQKEIKRAWITKLTKDSDTDDEEEEATGADKVNTVQTNKNGTHGNSSGVATDEVDEAVPMEKIPQVIYASRTHSQLTQAMRELRNSPYKDIKAGVFASRAQLCINPDVEKSTNVMYKCRSLTKNNCCKFRNNLHAKMIEPDFKKPILDIEDLVKFGKEFECCSYYASKELQKNAEILFMPYNYLLDPKIRDICAIDLKNAIVIFDEAHNVEKACEQTAGASITTADLFNANQELNEVFQELGEIDANEDIDENLEFNYEHVSDLQSRLLDLEGILSRSAMTSNGQLHNGGHLFKLFQSAQITNENYKGYSDLMNNLAQFLCNKGYDAKGLKKTSEFLSTAFSNSAEELKNKVDKCCKVKIEKNRDFMNSATLNFWCLSPALGIKPLIDKEIRCLIMTSGTLQPLDELETEMEIPTPIIFTNEHIIDPSQVFVNIVSKGKDGVIFDATFKNRYNVDYLKSLGESIIDLCDFVPGGLLVFFASYPVREVCHDFWKNRCDVWKRMSIKRDIYCEIKGEPSDMLEKTKNKYYESINEKGGAIFMAVLRGKVSEGVDFIDTYGRAVVIVGIPLAVYHDTKTKSKRDYMDGRNATDRKVKSGDEWYNLDAIKAVNQAIGRVIRHKNDYGAILLCDHRYNNLDKNKHLSTWVRENPSTGTFVNFQTMTEQLKDFFAHCERTLPKPKSKHQSASVRLDFDDVEDDDDNVHGANTSSNANEGFSSSNHFNAVYLEEENSDDRSFINDESIDDQYSDSSGTRKNHKKSKKRQRRSPKKRANRRKQSYSSPKKKLKRQVSTSTTESSIDQNTDDERFLDDGNSANDSDFIDDESVDDQYSSASSVSGALTRSNGKLRTTRSKTLKKRMRQRVKRYSRGSPQPSTSYVHYDRADNDEKQNGNNSDSDEGEIKMNRSRNGKNFKRIIFASDSESDSTKANDNDNENPIIACFKRSLSTNQYKKLVDAFNEYTKDNGSYDSYRDTLFELFSGSNENSSLMGMMLLLKFEHQSMFDEDIKRKFAE